MFRPTITIINLRKPSLKLPTIRIDRKTWLGNPFIIGADGNRTTVIQKYDEYFNGLLATNTEIQNQFYRLCKDFAYYENIQLACWCAPLPCHGIVIKTAMLEYYRKNEHA